MKRASRRGPSRSRPDATTPRGARFFGLGDPSTEKAERADVVLAGIPTPLGVGLRAGVHEAPATLRALSYEYGGYSQAFGLSLFEELEVCDGGDVDPRGELEAISQRVEERTRAGQTMGLVGGTGLVTLAALRGLVRAKKRSVGLLHFNAHHALEDRADERGALTQILADKLARPKRVMQVGVRGPVANADQNARALANGFEVVPTDEVLFDVHATMTQVREFCRRGSVYISFDVGVLDPGLAPGATRPSPGGLSVWAAHQLIRATAGAEVVGFDVVGYAPPYDPGGTGGLAVVSILHEMLAAIAESRRPVESGRGRKHPSGRRSA